MKVVFDYDLIAYKAASACEAKSIKVTFKATGKSKVFKNREEFYGRKNNISGFLGEYNKKQETPLTLEDFEIEDLSTTESKETLRRVVSGMINNILTKVGYNEFSDTYMGYLGKGETFRHRLATLLEYKANRTQKPLLLKDAKNFIYRKHGGVIVDNGLEADDEVARVQYQGYENWLRTGDDDDKVIVVTIDKDSLGVDGFIFNPDNEDGVIEINGFGELHITSKDKVKGTGRLWTYFQIAYGDPVDNYRANCFSDTRWGPKSAYDRLKDCKNDKEALEQVVSIYKELYPEPKTVIGHRGNEIMIDWKYVLKEVSQLAVMKFSDKEFDILKILEEHGISHD